MSKLDELPEVLLPLLPESPYPGLRPFEKSEWPIFIGRERMASEISNRLLEQKVVFVHGPSGGGKSSLVRAGIQASLEQKHARSELRWLTCAMRPGISPLKSLSEALAGLVKDERRSVQIRIHRALNHGRKGLASLAELLNLGQRDRVCILLDQFEEIFLYRSEFEREEAGLLSKFLVDFTRDPPIQLYVIVTMRSEFLGECSRFEGLAEVVNRTQYLLPKMDTEDLLRAVQDPAELFGWIVTDRLSERIVADAQSEHDELPLVQHGLARLWSFANKDSISSSSRVLDMPLYTIWGPLDRLISQHADDIANSVLRPEVGGNVVEEIFRALTDVNADGNAIRRPQRVKELESVTGCEPRYLREVLDAFRQPGPRIGDLSRGILHVEGGPGPLLHGSI